MPKFVVKLFSFLILTSYFLHLTSSVYAAAEPGLNLINQPGTQFYVPGQDSFNWLLYTPGSPDELKAWTPTTNNIVIRIHSEWTPIGQLMLGMPSQQQQAANDWCSALNQFQGKTIYVQPFNELEHDYARQTPTGGIGLDTAIIRAKVFTDYLQACLAPGITITSPALEPQSVDFPTTSAAFVPNYSVISCMPYRLDTIDSCIQAAAGKPLIFTEIGVDRNGPKYDNCSFVESFCDEGFINKIQQIPNLLAYFLFTFSPGNFDGYWELKTTDVVKALKNQCSASLSEYHCKGDSNKTIEDLVNKIKNNPKPQDVAPLPARGVNSGPNYYSRSENLIVRFITWLNGLLSRDGGQRYPFNFRNEQYVEDPFTQSGQMDPKITKIIQPTTEVLDQIATISQGSTSKQVTVNHANKIENYTSKEYIEAIARFGPGFMFSTESEHYDFFEEYSAQQARKDFNYLKSGISSRVQSYSLISDEAVDKVLCQLAASRDPSNPAFIQNPKNRLFDEVLGYLTPNKESDYVDLLPVGGGKQTVAMPDRTHTRLSDGPVPIKISTIFCINENLPSFLAKCSSMGYGSISSDVCRDAAPDWLLNAVSNLGLEGAIFRTFYPRLRQHATVLNQNASSKAFIERCQEMDPTNCQGEKVFGSDFDGISQSKRTQILDEYGGEFFKVVAATCYTCKVDIFFLTNLTKANQTANFVGRYTTSYQYHSTIDQSPQTISYSKDTVSKTGVFTPDYKTPLGIDNKDQKYDYQRGSFAERFAIFVRTLLFGSPCQITYVTDENGVSIPQNTCDNDKRSALTTTIYIPSEAFAFVNATQLHNNSILPYKTQQDIKQAINKATDNTSNDLKTNLILGYHTGNYIYGGKDSAKNMFDKNQDMSADHSFDQNAKTVTTTKNTTVDSKIRDYSLMPYSWQKEINSQTSASSLYESNRPIEGDLPNTDRTPNTDWCQFITQSITSSTNSLITPSLIAAIISVESQGDPKARSSQGAIGLMQVMPSDPVDREGNPLYFDCDGHSCFINRPTSAQLFDPAFNINYSVQLLSGMINYWGRDKNTPQEKIREGLKHYGPMHYEYIYADLVLAVQANNPTACSP